MLTLEEIIANLEDISTKQIPELSQQIAYHSKLLADRYDATKSLFPNLSNPAYAFHFLAYISTIYDARFTIRDTINICEEISELASELISHLKSTTTDVFIDSDDCKTNDQKSNSSNAKALSSTNDEDEIKEQITFCDDLIEELSQFTDTVNIAMNSFGKLCSTDSSFGDNVLFILNELHNDELMTWCKTWLSGLPVAQGFDSYLEEAISRVVIPVSQPILVAAVH